MNSTSQPRDWATSQAQGPERDAQVRRILYIEGAANLSVLGIKTAVGCATGSVAILGDAVHSLADVANNLFALVVMRVAVQPADREHPYGHRKFETLAVFGLAGLLTVMAVEVGLGAIRATERHIETSTWSLATMILVLGINLAVATWQARWAKRLDSDILRADSRHTLVDVLTTVVVIAGWQLAARGPAWLDTVFALGVAVVVLTLAFGLFKRSIPILVDRIAVAPEALHETVASVAGVHDVTRVRSRHTGAAPAVDVVVQVDPDFTTVEGHEVADEIEAILQDRYRIVDVTVHIEPYGTAGDGAAPPPAS